MAVLDRFADSTSISRGRRSRKDSDYQTGSFERDSASKPAEVPSVKLKAAGQTLPVIEEDNEGIVNASSDLIGGVSALATNEAINRRVAVASELTTLAGRVVASFGKPKMTADLLLLQKALSNAHGQMQGLRSERDYVSIVSLAEASLQNLKWKEVSKPALEQVLAALRMGTEQKAMSYDEVNRQAHAFRARGLQTLPIFENDEAEEAGAE
jgi:hypothetical protein